MYLLNIQSSPRRARSASIAVADALVEAYRQVYPDVIVDTLNVWEENLPEFDQEAIGAKYKGVNQEAMNEAEQKGWDRIQELAARFKRADRIVIGVPMWNFAYPYKLKQLIDLVAATEHAFYLRRRNVRPIAGDGACSVDPHARRRVRRRPADTAIAVRPSEGLP